MSDQPRVGMSWPPWIGGRRCGIGIAEEQHEVNAMTLQACFRYQQIKWETGEVICDCVHLRVAISVHDLQIVLAAITGLGLDGGNRDALSTFSARVLQRLIGDTLFRQAVGTANTNHVPLCAAERALQVALT